MLCETLISYGISLLRWTFTDCLQDTEWSRVDSFCWILVRRNKPVHQIIFSNKIHRFRKVWDSVRKTHQKVTWKSSVTTNGIHVHKGIYNSFIDQSQTSPQPPLFAQVAGRWSYLSSWHRYIRGDFEKVSLWTRNYKQVKGCSWGVEWVADL